MAEDAKGSAVTAGGPGGGDPAVSSDTRGQREGLLSRLWHGLFRGRREDYEKKLQYLSKEEASVQALMKRRARRGRKTARNIIVFSVVLEVVAVTYAIIATRSPELSWQMRAVHVLPMFVLPALSSAIYLMFLSLTRMFDRKDQRTLERLRAERQAKIDELKERTNYYTIQQLIQRYDLDPAAKAAAATVLASKMGADSGLKVYVGDHSEPDTPLGKSSNVELVQSDGGLRSRKRPRTSHQSMGHEMLQQFVREASPEVSVDDQEVSAQTQRAFEHYRGWGTGDGGWIARIAAMLVGEDPSQCYALICGNCHMHNGLARKEDFSYITYYCPHCHALNGSRQAADSGFNSGEIAASEPSDDGVIAPDVSKRGSVTEVEVPCKLATSEGPIEEGKIEQPGVPIN